MSNNMFRIRHKLDPTYEAEDSSQNYANPNIPSFLNLLSLQKNVASSIQVLQDGRALSAEALMRGELDISLPILVEDTPESIGMTVFKPSSLRKNRIDNSVTVRHVADVIGHLYPVRVLDVQHQEELQGWTLGDLVDFFEDEDRLRRASRQQQQQQKHAQAISPEEAQRYRQGDEHMSDEHKRGGTSRRTKRKAAEKASDVLLNEQNKPRALNQLSLEFSDTPLRRFVESPQFVRDLDWIDNAWPSEMRKEKISYPAVQYYCLTSTAGCYTDFHVDFGGTAVWYHVLSGAKAFCLIKPTAQNLAIYEKWLGHPQQESLFLPNMIPDQNEVITTTLRPGQTLFIPTAWIHAVYTPDDSVVLGGNLLHGLDLRLQLEANAIEGRRRIHDKFRFPYFKRLHFYVAAMYLRRLQKHEYVCKRELDNLLELLKALEMWLDEANTSKSSQNEALQGAAMYAAKHSGCNDVNEMLKLLRCHQERAIKEGLNKHPFEHKMKPCGDGDSGEPFKRQGLSIKPVKSSSLSGNDSMTNPKSPRIRLSMGQPSPRNSTTKSASDRNQEDTDGFRIVISQVAKELHKPLPSSVVTAKKKESREDTEYIDLGHDDDDWMPSATLRKKVSGPAGTKKAAPSSKKPLPEKWGTLAGNRISKGTKQAKSKGPAPKMANKPTTARQRLLKRFR